LAAFFAFAHVGGAEGFGVAGGGGKVPSSRAALWVARNERDCRGLRTALAPLWYPQKSRGSWLAGSSSPRCELLS